VKKDILTFLLFVALAAAVWYGHAMQSVRNTRVPVYITYTGKPGSIGLGEPGLPDTVMIEVRDAGAQLNTYHREPLRLTIDLHSYIHGEKGTIQIPSDALRRSISDILLGTSKLIDAKPDEITCPYFTEQEKSVALVFRGELSPASEYQFVGEPVMNRKRIKIYGEGKNLNAIDTVYTEFVQRSDLSDTVVFPIAIAPISGIRLEKDSVTLTVITERYTEKKFMIPIHVTGVPEGCHIRLFPKEVEVSVRVGFSHFGQVQASDIKAVCAYSPQCIDKMNVETHYTNPYITAAWSYPGVVEYILEQ
jgi:hypothetical protein